MGWHEITRLCTKNLVYVFNKFPNPTLESQYMKPSTTSKNNFVIWKFYAKGMNGFQQAFSRNEVV
jgi:hypothetical protein